jgi:hypothetical protein
MYLVKIGERLYEFNSTQDVIQARNIYAEFIGSQNDFETELENSNIEFTYDDPGFFMGR